MARARSFANTRKLPSGRYQARYWHLGKHVPIDHDNRRRRSLILEDLRSFRLADIGTGMVTGRAISEPWISNRGRRFLDWLRIVWSRLRSPTVS